ncbi:MAG: F0F1 ATP synthase subunit B, partial [Treponema sp.]|nr:F0F1 ATP synthase subunit B [Treponema sp.]
MIDPSITTFLVTLFNIAVLFLVFRALLFKPVSKFMNDRTAKIEGDIARADRDKKDARQLLEQYEKRLAAAETEAEGIIRAAREQAQAEADRIAAEGRAAAERFAAAARSRLETERLAALSVFRAEAAALVVAAAGRLLKRELAGAEQLRYAAGVLEEIAA